METPGESVIDPCVGIIFCPTNEEIINILKHKRSHPDFYVNGIFEDNVYKYEPDMLKELGDIQNDGKWYFFCARNPLNPGGERFSRATETGYWKVTGKILPIKAKRTQEEIGTKRTLVFYKRFGGGREERTNWVMHEYSADNNPQDLVVCKIKEKKNKRTISTKNTNKRATKRRIPANDVFQSEASRCDAVENTYPEPYYHSVSNFNSHAVEDTLQVDTLPLENLNVLDSSTRLDQTSFSTQSPILPEQGSSSSSVSVNENEVLNSSFGSESKGDDYLQEWVLVDLMDEVLSSSFGNKSEGEDYLQEWDLFDLMDELLSEETGHARGSCGGDSSDESTELFNAWVNEIFQNNTSEVCLNYI